MKKLVSPEADQLKILLGKRQVDCSTIKIQIIREDTKWTKMGTELLWQEYYYQRLLKEHDRQESICTFKASLPG